MATDGSGAPTCVQRGHKENRRAGDAGIQTRDLFAALLRVRLPKLEPIVEELPIAASLEPTEGAVADEPYIVSELSWFALRPRQSND